MLFHLIKENYFLCFKIVWKHVQEPFSRCVIIASDRPLRYSSSFLSRHSVHYFGSRSCGAEELQLRTWISDAPWQSRMNIFRNQNADESPKTGSLYHRDETVCWLTVRYELHKYRNLQAQKDIIDIIDYGFLNCSTVLTLRTLLKRFYQFSDRLSDFEWLLVEHPALVVETIDADRHYWVIAITHWLMVSIQIVLTGNRHSALMLNVDYQFIAKFVDLPISKPKTFRPKEASMKFA